MDASTKTRSLVSIIVFLLLSNIAILVFFIFLDNRKGRVREDRNAISGFLEKEIGFDKQQMDDYQNLRTAHMQNARPLFEGIRSAKDSFYNFLYTDATPDSVIFKAAAIIGEKQMQLDMLMFHHLKKVRSLCTPEELPKFDSLFKKVVERMTGGRVRRSDHTKKNK